MKTKNISIAILLLVTQLSFAQYFKLTPAGFLSNEKNDFTVVDVPNVKQKDLYRNTLNAINSIFKNPQKGLSVVEGESISITAYEEEVLPVKLSNGFGKTIRKYDLSYKLTFLFKDGKIRINSPDFEAKRYVEGTYRGASGWTGDEWVTLKLVKIGKSKLYLFEDDGKIRFEDAYNGLNNHFNSLIKEIINKSQSINNW
ncbi:DUF4468 domain-containing protein [Chryseobacterium formosus]|uniref:DUF4468 domain-containing protein n=1 Tax=Chryseobacterium formosus TaxID=1537363 RepID=A0ABT3XXD6_9FLAO|nr:DUF4468 domain-containing protein [Chryseobacterium formosus]MCX8526338.1 DUF4468 domain-containing protein [Chryseobacterium formosus]